MSQIGEGTREVCEIQEKSKKIVLVRAKREIMDSNPNDDAVDANGKRASVYLGGGDPKDSD